MLFASYNIDNKLVNILHENGYDEPSKIQQLALKDCLKNKSAFVKAPTGSGKTLCYLIPILNDLDISKLTQAIIIVPTTLLVDQLYYTFKKFSSYKDFKIDVIKDGTSKNISSYKGHIIIATPSQFLFNYSKINLKDIKRLVIDEVDMIIFDGFQKQLEEILSLKINCSKFCFSASVDQHLNAFVKKYISVDKIIKDDEENITSKNVSHYFVDIKNRNKFDALKLFLKHLNPYKALIFTSSKQDLSELDKYLTENQISHLSVSGSTSKREQTRSIKEFINNQSNILIGTDLISRGFDVNDISDVISLDLPKTLTYYYHRAGRTGRFDKKGNSYVFYNESNLNDARKLNSKNLNFKFMVLKEDQIKLERNLADFDKKKNINNKFLEAEIKKNIYKLRTKKVKPNYKKKIRNAIKRTKQKHKEDVIKANISKRNEKEGTSFSYYNKDNYSKNKGSK